MVNTLSRTLVGSIMIIFGLVLMIISPFLAFVPLIYGLPLFVIGLIIFFNKKEDNIEKIKSKGGKK
jgi:ABC-type bacteriocin/lantibiotic exporter with double-glycine peptidase domain